MSTKFNPNWVSKPGETMTDILEERGLTIQDFAKGINRSVDLCRKYIDGTLPLTAGRATLISSFLGSTPAFWIKREKHYRKGLEKLKNGKANPEK